MKLTKIKGEHRCWIYRGWEIRGVGGFCTLSRFECSKGNQWFHDFIRKDAMAKIDALEAGLPMKDVVYDFQTRSLYI